MATDIDLNCDMGESYGRWTLRADEEIMPWITSAHVPGGLPWRGGGMRSVRKESLRGAAPWGKWAAGVRQMGVGARPGGLRDSADHGDGTLVPRKDGGVPGTRPRGPGAQAVEMAMAGKVR